ncbi:hypothetical protein B4942_19255 [Vibrio cholerae]|nr:hypothetical protein [Vibrio cholerae]MCD1200609.1 hypothetical protein [Vibrio cholerae]
MVLQNHYLFTVFLSCVKLLQFEYKALTNASRGTANAWHFFCALIFVITLLYGSSVVALAAP